jgi:hypothetical protein
MKNLIVLSIALFSLSLNTQATNIKFTKNTLVETSDTSSLSQLLSLYYNIKDALVASNAELASAKAGEFLKAVNGIDMKSLSAADHSAYMSVSNKLAFDARHISETKEISHQREHFKSLSDNFFVLAKKTKLSSQPIYQVYCPMKKAYWLSSEMAIRNPYFGNQMLDCGKVTATLK